MSHTNSTLTHKCTHTRAHTFFLSLSFLSALSRISSCLTCSRMRARVHACTRVCFLSHFLTFSLPTCSRARTSACASSFLFLHVCSLYPHLFSLARTLSLSHSISPLRSLFLSPALSFSDSYFPSLSLSLSRALSLAGSLSLCLPFSPLF